MLIVRLLSLFLLFTLCTSLLVTESQAAPLWYTVQVGSFTTQKDAENLYAELASELPPTSRKYLRIEKVSSYYTVRVGKFNSRHEVMPLLETINKWSADSAIIHAFILDSRIIRSFSSEDTQTTTQKKSDIIIPKKSISQHAKEKEPLYYTVQIGTFLKKQDTTELYHQLAQQLPPVMREYLRVEKISSFFTVRIGKAERRQEIFPLYRESKKFTANPTIIHGYLRNTRIINSYSSFHSLKRQATSVTAPITSSHVTPPKANISTEIVDESSINKSARSTPMTNTGPAKILKENISVIEPLFYTIQMGSFVGKNDAGRFYNFLAQKLPENMRDFLRVEKISAFFAVRLGKTEKRSDIKAFFAAAEKFSDNPTIIHAYFRNSRIIKSIQTPSPPPAKKNINLAKSASTEQKQKSKKAFSKKPTLQNKTLQEDTDSTTPQIVVSKTIDQEVPSPPKSTRLFQPEEPLVEKKIPAILQPQKIPPAITSEEFEKIILSKYLDTSYKEQDVANSRKHADAFAATATCTTADCHNSILNIQKGHYPAQESKCKSCHEQTNKQHPNSISPSFQLREAGAKLCSQCHLSIIQGNNIHSPIAEGECILCHDPHGSGNPYLLTVAKGNEQQLCSECHDDNTFDYKYLHGPVGMGACTHCHNPHASDYEMLLREEPKKLCITCHSYFIKGLQESPYVHSTVQEKGCQSCHSAHGSEFPNLLNEEPEKFCFSCHQDVEKKFAKSRSKHAGLYLDKQCGTCHLAHYSKHPFLLVKEEMELCLDCHRSDSDIGSYKPKDILRELQGKEYIHAPVAEGNCTGCHDQHGSQNDSLLIGKAPTSFYAPYDPEKYSLCFICHDQELLTELNTTDSTNFRNGDNNLHYVHVAIEHKGRTCQACHMSHASNGPKLINRTGATFGVWTMSIDFFINETGGSCMPGCHRELAYDREIPVSYTHKDNVYEKSFIDYQSK